MVKFNENEGKEHVFYSIACKNSIAEFPPSLFDKKVAQGSFGFAETCEKSTFGLNANFEVF